MATFVWAESPGTTEDSRPNERVLQLGNGYRQVSIDALRPVLRSWQVRFDEAGKTGGNAIDAFLRANAGISFDWSPPWATAPIKVRCTSWNRTVDEEGYTSSITATFEEWVGP